MKRSEVYIPSRLEKLIVGILATIVALLPLHAFISTWGGTAIGPLWLWKSWKELLLVPLVGLVLFWLCTHLSALRVLLRDRLIQVGMVYTVLVLVFTRVGWTTLDHPAVLAGFAFDLRYIAMFILGYIAVRFGRLPYATFTPRIMRSIVWIGVALAVVGILQVTIIPREFLSQFGYEKFVTIAPYLTIDEKSPYIIRAFATLRGPNDYGAYLVMTLAVTLASVMATRRKLSFAGLQLIAIFLSHSRSAYIAAFVVLGLWLGLTIGSERLKRYWLYIVGGVVSLLLIASLSLVSPTVRLIVFHSSVNDTHLTEGSIDDRSNSMTATLGRVIENPLGCGTGCSGPASYYGADARISENYYLQIAEEYGIVGVGLWIAMFVLVMRRLYVLRRSPLAFALFMSGAGIAIIGLLLHVWVDDPLSMTWWVLAGLVVPMTMRDQRSLRGK